MAQMALTPDPHIMPEWREMTKQTEWQAKKPSQAACFSEDLKCWGAWDTTCGHKAKDITPSIARSREAFKEEAIGDLPWKDERGPLSDEHSGMVSKAMLVKLLSDGVERILAFHNAEKPSWTELNHTLITHQLMTQMVPTPDRVTDTRLKTQKVAYWL